jgi:vanillate O-demethylase ferredoxin subunit
VIVATENQKLEVFVANRADEADGIVSFELRSNDGGDLPAFVAGAHIDVHLESGLSRQYSICSDPAERNRYQLGILREPSSRGGSAFIHANLREGARLSISPPRCSFPLVEDARRTILIAGGIGVTPLLAMAHRLAALGREFALHYCCRTMSRVAFRDVVLSGFLAPFVQLHLSDGTFGQRFAFDIDVGPVEPDTHLYVCGPEGFIQSVVESAERLGWPKEQIHVEFFIPRPMQEMGDQPFTVVAARSKVTIEVEADETVAQALTRAGLDIPLSCEQGICRTCLTDVLDGEPLHRDDCLSEAERQSNRLMTICCSRAKSRSLVLNI